MKKKICKLLVLHATLNLVDKDAISKSTIFQNKQIKLQ